MKKILLIIFCLLTSYPLVAQQTPNFSNNLPGTADASATVKAGNVPVNYFTGIPAISVPIHSYKKSGIGTNVSLEYSAGGIKVDEDATNVGLGWHLNAGGMITPMRHLAALMTSRSQWRAERSMFFLKKKSL